MIAGFAYLVVGWLFIAVVGGLADVLSLTVMLPATSAVVITHAAFSRRLSLPGGVALAIALGYLEDLHQGAPVGTLALSHGLSFLILRWASGRFHLGGWVLRSLASVAAIAVIDLLTFGTLLVMSDALSLRREALVTALSAARWHALATALVAAPVWSVLDRVLTLLRVADDPPPSSGLNTAGSRGGDA
jgi:hypothetical protein